MPSVLAQCPLCPLPHHTHRYCLAQEAACGQAQGLPLGGPPSPGSLCLNTHSPLALSCFLVLLVSFPPWGSWLMSHVLPSPPGQLPSLCHSGSLWEREVVIS